MSEALIFASTNPQYDDRLFIELQVQYMKIPSSEHGENVVYRNCFWHSEQFLYTTCSPHILQTEELLTKIYLYKDEKVLDYLSSSCALLLHRNNLAGPSTTFASPLQFRIKACSPWWIVLNLQQQHILNQYEISWAKWITKRFKRSLICCRICWHCT